MDLTPQMFKVLDYLIPAVALILVLKSSWFKGIFGEFIVNTAAKLLLNKDEYKTGSGKFASPSCLIIGVQK